MAKTDISILLTAHTEGLLVHKTLRSLQAALNQLNSNNVHYEVLIHIDKGDKETTEYLKRQNIVKAKIFENSFGDLGSSRNFLVSKAKGKYVATLDADDLISDNWLADAYKYLRKSSKEIVVHTEYSVNFGQTNVLWPKSNSEELNKERLINVSDNRWDSALMCSKKILKDYPYSENKGGYGPEDWYFNSQTLNAGIQHHIVPKTTLFVRRKPTSVMSMQKENYHTLPYTDLLDIKKIQNIDIEKYPPEYPWLDEPKMNRYASLLKRAISVLKKYSVILAKEFKPTRKLVESVKKLKNTKDNFELLDRPEVPTWLYKQWRDVHEIERTIFPSKKLNDSLIVYRSDFIKPRGYIFKKIADKLSDDHTDHLILAPWLIHGGGDLVAIRYANTLAKQNPDKRIALFTTEKRKSPWASKLDDNIDFVDYGLLTASLSDSEILKLLARIIVQSKVSNLQIVNSRLGFSWVENHKELVKTLDLNIYPAAFCEDVNEEGRTGGYIHTHLPQIYDVSTKILSENQNTVNSLVKEYGFRPEKFNVHYMPVDPVAHHWQASKGKNSNKLLWASRIAKQKRPDLLVAIARKLLVEQPDIIIEAYGTLGKNYENKILKANLPNLVYKGEFDGFYSLNHSDYRGFIYTSDYDGMPNIILEACNVGIPIISSDVGGIHEIITDEKNGFLVNNDANEFVKHISKLISLPTKELSKMSKLSRNSLSSHHSYSMFEKKVKKDINL